MQPDGKNLSENFIIKKKSCVRHNGIWGSEGGVTFPLILNLDNVFRFSVKLQAPAVLFPVWTLREQKNLVPKPRIEA
jgi:hypothetical protein